MAAREKNGVFVAKENYEEMLEEQREQKAKIEELEGQLEVSLVMSFIITFKSWMHRVSMLMQDLSTMDDHYITVYERCRLALLKLEKRAKEIGETKAVRF